MATDFPIADWHPRLADDAPGHRSDTPPQCPARVANPSDRLGFFLFLLLTGNLFLRPLELIPALRAIRIHEILTAACLILMFPAILRQMTWRSLKRRPVTLLVIGFVLTAVLSNLWHGDLAGVKAALVEMSPSFLYFLFLLIGVDSFVRLRTFILVIIVCIAIVSALSLLQFKGLVDLHSDDYGISAVHRDSVSDSGEVQHIRQLQAWGIFSDPNDFSILLVTVILLSMMFLARAGWAARPFWVFLIAMLLYTFALTLSRGGFLSLLSGLGVVIVLRFGWRRAIVVGSVVLPLVLILFAGRQTSINIRNQDDTAYRRVELWQQGIEMFKAHPLLGVGYAKFEDEVGLVAHNSYVHCYAELGFIGGTMFSGAVGLIIVCLNKLRREASLNGEGDIRSWILWMCGIMIAYSVGIFSVSRAYSNYTFLLFGIVTCFVTIGQTRLNLVEGFTIRLATKIIALSAVWLLLIRIFIAVIL